MLRAVGWAAGAGAASAAGAAVAGAFEIKQRDLHGDTVNRFQWAMKNYTRQSGHQKVKFFDSTKRRE